MSMIIPFWTQREYWLAMHKHFINSSGLELLARQVDISTIINAYLIVMIIIVLQKADPHILVPFL